MGMFDMFKPAPVAPAAPAAPNSGTPTVPTDPQTPPGQMPGSQQVPANPLDAYAKLFDNSGKPADAPPSFTLDPKVLGEAASTISFTQGIPPDLMAKATSGDAAAMIEMMNLVGRNAYQQSLSHSSALTDRFVAARSDFDSKGVGAKVTGALTSAALADAPNYSHPVVKAEFTRIANAFQSQNPESTPAQIATATKEYMQNLHNAMNPGTQTPATAAAQPTDWEQWMNT